MAGDLVLRLKQKKVHKLASPWEGPYIVTEALDSGAYRLKNPKTGEACHNPWNAAQLRVRRRADDVPGPFHGDRDELLQASQNR